MMQVKASALFCGRYGHLILAWAVRLTSWLLRGLFLTLRPVYVKQHCDPRLRKSCDPVLLALWHGRLLYFIPLYRSMPFTVLVSRSRDGEFISQVLRWFGGIPARGSSSRGGARALLEVIKRVRQGSTVVFTPDGPRGPRYQVQPGIVAVAKKTGAPIVPVTYNAAWKTVLNSWDEFIVPFPFSRIVVVYGEPIYVPANASADTFDVKRQEVEASLCHITTIADTYFP
jgi:lysophospholipid acyltransferase (LPLAT)-like uncharacterized protein